MNPKEISDIELVFPASVKELMPEWEEIPDEYKKGDYWSNRFQRDWFFFGIVDYSIPWNEEIDPETAFRHLAAIQGSFEPKHEHKEAAVSYLLDSWTDGEATWERKNK